MVNLEIRWEHSISFAAVAKALDGRFEEVIRDWCDDTARNASEYAKTVRVPSFSGDHTVGAYDTGEFSNSIGYAVAGTGETINNVVRQDGRSASIDESISSSEGPFGVIAETAVEEDRGDRKYGRFVEAGTMFVPARFVITTTVQDNFHRLEFEIEKLMEDLLSGD